MIDISGFLFCPSFSNFAHIHCPLTEIETEFYYYEITVIPRLQVGLQLLGLEAQV